MNIFNSLQIINIGEDRCVTFLGETLVKFNTFTDDYAYTHAQDFYEAFKKFFLAHPELMIEERTLQAKNYAHASLDDSNLNETNP